MLNFMYLALVSVVNKLGPFVKFRILLSANHCIRTKYTYHCCAHTKAFGSSNLSLNADLKGIMELYYMKVQNARIEIYKLLPYRGEVSYGVHGSRNLLVY